MSHAELNAIKKASKKLGDWRLEGCTMYVTLEPCQMCAGAIVQARIDEVVIGSMNPKAGCAGSVLNLLDIPQFNHQVKITRGILQEECSALLSDFFRELRKRKKEPKKRHPFRVPSFLFLRAALRQAPMDVTSTVNSVQAPSRHTEGSA